MIEKFRKTFVAALFAGVLLLAGAAGATEGGGGAYPNGADDFMGGAAPPPGNYFINYFEYYSPNKFKNNNGDTIDGFNLQVAANVFRFIHMTDKTLLGATWGMHAFVPLVYMDVELNPGFVPFHMDDSRGSLGDIIVDPVILAWHGANWHATTGVDIFMPTGNYNKDRLANIGRNYWTFEPVIAATFLPGAGFDVSAKLMYDFNTTNDKAGFATGARDYRSGQEFHMDYAVGKKMDALTAGLAGYYYKQMTSDEADGVKVGNRGQVLALGPALKYDYKNLSFTLKYLFETEVKNRPQGDSLWVKVLYAF